MLFIYLFKFKIIWLIIFFLSFQMGVYMDELTQLYKTNWKTAMVVYPLDLFKSNLIKISTIFRC